MKFVPLLKQRKVTPGRLTSTVVITLLLLVSVGCTVKSGVKPEQMTKPALNPALKRKEHEAVQHWLLTGNAYAQAGENSRAQVAYLRALTYDPDNLIALQATARLKMVSGDAAEAAGLYRRILEIEPTEVTALTQLGLLNIEQRKYSAAQGYLQQAIILFRQRNPVVGSAATDQQRSAYNALAVLADLSGDYQQAQRLYHTALQYAPDNAAVINNRGYSHYLASRWQAAKQSYTRALQLSPEYGPSWRNLGLLYTRQGMYMEALQAFGHLMNENEAYGEMGYICMLEGKYQRALYFLNRASQLSPGPDKSLQQQRLRVLQLMQARTEEDRRLTPLYGRRDNNNDPVELSRIPGATDRTREQQKDWLQRDKGESEDGAYL